MSLAWLLAKRFRSRRDKKGFLSFISASSTTGIALGCAVLIAALSMMNGFQNVLQNKLLSVVPHVEYSAVEGELKNWELISKVALEHPGVTATAPGINSTVMVQTDTSFHGIQLKGIDPAKENTVSELANYVSQKDWQRWTSEGGILLGAGIAEKLNVKVGDSLSILFPEKSQRGFQSPKRKRLKITGLFEFGGEIDHLNAYVSLDTAMHELTIADGVTSVRLALSDVFTAPAIAQKVGNQLPELVYLNDWTRTHGHLYRDIELVRSVVYLVLVLVMAVACFNIVSTLVMTVAKKRRQIAMLKTLGMKDRTLLLTFMLQGIMNGLYGVLWGAGIGILLGQFMPDIMRFIESLFNIDILDGGIYFVSDIPSQWQWNDVVLVSSVALIMSWLATIYPAWRAIKVEPAKALHDRG